MVAPKRQTGASDRSSPGLLLTAFICEADHGILLPVYATFERDAIGFPYGLGRGQTPPNSASQRGRNRAHTQISTEKGAPWWTDVIWNTFSPLRIAAAFRRLHADWE
jgi:hypothetical protein